MSAGSQPSAAEPWDTFVAELQHWRRLRGLSQKQLAGRMGYDPSYISKIEGGRQRPTAGFARRADEVLHAGRTIWRRWQEYETRPTSTAGTPGTPRTAGTPRAAGTVGPLAGAGTAGTAPTVLVEHDEALLTYVAGDYQAVMRKRLTNLTEAPITRFPIRVAVDRFPDDPARSNRFYREHPLTLAELDLRAGCGTEPMDLETKLDRDSVKEFWLLFRNAQSRFPLYPGESVDLEYAYTVTDAKWGNWFQRAIRLPTARLSIQLVFPAALDPVVWGIENSLSTGQLPFRTAIVRQDCSGEYIFDWATEGPPLQARYRLEWRFRAAAGG